MWLQASAWSELPPESILMRSLYLMQLRHFWAAGWDCSSMWVGLSEQFFADPNRTVNELLVALRLLGRRRAALVRC